jgi:hypothetical protein
MISLEIPDPKAPADAESAGPHRLNIVFHGMMAFRDAGTEHYDVLIPFPQKTGHQALYGNPRHCPHDPYSCLVPFPDGASYWKVEGVWASNTPDKPSSASAMILNNGLLSVNSGGVRTVIRVPKPDIIRQYRGAEVRGLTLANDAPSQTTLANPPSVIYEATVFSYAFFMHPRLVGPGEPFPIPKFHHQYWNLCIYSQPHSICIEDDRILFDKMFTVKSSGTQLDVNLFLQDMIADGPPTKTSIGLTDLELAALSEMRGATGGCLLTSSPGGCGSGFISDGG